MYTGGGHCVDERVCVCIQVDIDDILSRAETRSTENDTNSATDTLLSQFKVRLSHLALLMFVLWLFSPEIKCE